MYLRTPGFALRADTEKLTLTLGFTYGLPIKSPSTVNLIHNTNGSTEAVASGFDYRFKTFSLMGHYTLLCNAETAGRFYASAGAGLVLVSFNEKIRENYDKANYTHLDLFEGGKESGFVMNLGIGGQ